MRRKRLFDLLPWAFVVVGLGFFLSPLWGATVYGFRVANLLQLLLVSTTDTAPAGWAQFVYDTTSITLTPRNSSNVDLSARKTGAIQLIFVGSPVAAAQVACADTPMSHTITAAVISSQESGSAEVEIWVDLIANSPLTAADKISASAPLSVTAGSYAAGNVSTWTKAIAANSKVCGSVNSSSTFTNLSVLLTTTRGLD